MRFMLARSVGWLAVLVLATSCQPDPLIVSVRSSSPWGLGGVWDGDASDWGRVTLVAAAEGYEGTYSSVFKPELGLGHIQLSKRGGAFVGTWRDSDGEHFGTLTARQVDDRTVQVTWQATDARRPLERESVWERNL